MGSHGQLSYPAGALLGKRRGTTARKHDARSTDEPMDRPTGPDGQRRGGKVGGQSGRTGRGRRRQRHTDKRRAGGWTEDGSHFSFMLQFSMLFQQLFYVPFFLIVMIMFVFCCPPRDAGSTIRYVFYAMRRPPQLGVLDFLFVSHISYILSYWGKGV